MSRPPTTERRVGPTVHPRRAVPSRVPTARLSAGFLFLAAVAFALSRLRPSPRLVVLVLWLVSVGVLVLIGSQHVARTWDLLTLRNVFLVGFLVFQTYSAATALHLDYYGGLVIVDSSRAGRSFAAMATVFLVVFLATYRFRAHRQGQPPSVEAAVGRQDRAFVTRVLAAAAISTMFGLVLDYGSYLGPPGLATGPVGIATVALSTSAAGLIGWAWGKSPRDPFVFLAGAVIFLLNIPVALAGQFGRRPLVSIFAAALWGAYHSKWRFLRGKRSAMLLAILSLLPLFTLALFTSARSAAEHRRSLRRQVEVIVSEGDAGRGFVLLRDSEITGAMSVWAVENFGWTQPYRPWLSVRYLLSFPVPRQLWPHKPEPLAKDFAAISHFPGVNPNYTLLPAGIIGTAAAEGGWLVLVVYGIGLAAILRYLDGLLARRPNDVITVVPLGCALGQVLGLARGETAVFLAILVVSIAVSSVMIRVFFRMVGIRSTVQVPSRLVTLSP